ncbi:MAG: hydroxysqualene dehydroxylase HpnE [Acidobacteriota bacterium]|nr:hydroxysqualene dehydroxylase HpnE [Acidobacteriota bacterium]
MDVVVVGGGFAGLSAGALLAERGARVTVLDARPQLGGRATAFVDRHTGELVDNGQHVLFGCYRETLDFLRRVGAMANVRIQPSMEVVYLDMAGRRSVLRCPPLPSPLHLVGAVLAWDAIPWRDRLGALKLAGPLRRARGDLRRSGSVSAEPAGTVSEWLLAHGQRRQLREWLWEPLAVAALNQSPEIASAAPFVRVLAEMFGTDRAAASLVLPTKPLHQMYAEPARDFIVAHGGDVRVNALARVVVERGRVRAVDVRGDRIEAATVIVAVPWFALRTLFTPAAPSELASVLAGAAAMESMPIVTVNLWYDRQVMDEPFVGLPGREMQWVFDKRIAFGGEASHLSLVSSGATRLALLGADELKAIAAREVEQALPRARAARLVRATVVREKQATFSLAPAQPARPGSVTPVEGLYLAGDWTDTGLPGTIESAVMSGHTAAKHVTRLEFEG